MSHRAREEAVALLASQVRLDERRLLDAMARQGVRYQHVDPRQMWSFADEREQRWRGVLNREIGQVRALYGARICEALGMPVLNSAAAIQVCGDKWQTSQALAAAGLPAPQTALGLTPEAALRALAQMGYPALIKPLVGSWGRLIVTLRDEQMAEDVFDYVRSLPGPQSHLVYVQELIAKPGRDIRAIVVGGELIGAVYRVATGTRTNVARGASTRPCPESADLTKLATAAAAAVGADIAAVDLVEDEDGDLLLLEVNHRVEFSGFQEAVGDRVDVADRIVEYMTTRFAGW